MTKAELVQALEHIDTLLEQGSIFGAQQALEQLRYKLTNWERE